MYTELYFRFFFFGEVEQPGPTPSHRTARRATSRVSESFRLFSDILATFEFHEIRCLKILFLLDGDENIIYDGCDESNTP